jgi:hypothetical protein
MQRLGCPRQVAELRDGNERQLVESMAFRA